MSINFDFPYFKSTATDINSLIEIKRLPESQAGQLLKAQLSEEFIVKGIKTGADNLTNLIFS